jgi:hypothetical protein
MTKYCSAFLSVLIFAALYSCQKSNSDKTPTLPSPTGTMTIAFSYPDTSSQAGPNFELIVSEPGGKILLDSVAPVNTQVTATLHTNDTLVNLTTIYQALMDSNITVNTYMSVNPSSWQTAVHDLLSYPYVIPAAPNDAGVTVRVINIPQSAQGDEPLWISNGSSGFAFDNPGGQTYLPTGIGGYSKMPVYISLPDQGLYTFVTATAAGVTDTIDLSQMDTAVEFNFVKPAGYTTVSSYLWGIPDTTDINKKVALFQSGAFLFSGLPTDDIVYPPRGMETFEEMSLFWGPNTATAGVYSYGSTLSGSFPFPTVSSYSLLSAEPDSMNVKFLTVSPTWYQTELQTGHVYYYFNSSPDSTIRHPLSLLTSLNSQKLKGQSLGNLTPVSLTFQSVQGMNYSAFMAYCATPGLLKTRRISEAVFFSIGL